MDFTNKIFVKTYFISDSFIVFKLIFLEFYVTFSPNEIYNRTLRILVLSMKTSGVCITHEVGFTIGISYISMGDPLHCDLLFLNQPFDKVRTQSTRSLRFVFYIRFLLTSISSHSEVRIQIDHVKGFNPVEIFISMNRPTSWILES